MKSYYLNGLLTLNENNLSKMDYIIKDKITQEQTSITSILEEIFNRDSSISKLVRVVGRVYNSTESFNGMGNLHMCRDKSHKVEGYCIGSMQLENWLFKNVDNFCELVIEDYTSFEIAEELMSNEDAKSVS